jgi:chemotaxis protein MotB
MAGNGVAVTQNDQNTKRLEELKQKLEAEIKAKKELEKLSNQIEITITPEGLRIELIEDKNGKFYQSGSAQLSASGQELLSLLAAELKTLPNQLLIEGHTDAAQYSTDANYSNWELSADRANSARRLLQQDGVRRDQVTQVRGFADQMLRVKNNPFDPSNRRITILVKNQDNAPPELAHAAVVDGGSGGAAPGAGATPTAPKAQSPPATPPANSARPAAAPTSTPAKPSAAQPATKPGIMGKLTSMLPGSKK